MYVVMKSLNSPDDACEASCHDDSRSLTCCDLQAALLEIHPNGACGMALIEDVNVNDATANSNADCSHVGTIDCDENQDETIDNIPTQDFSCSIDHDHNILNHQSQGDKGSSNRTRVSLIQRNKSIACVGGMHPVLTVEEEERIVQMMRQDDDDVDQYARASSTEGERESEIDAHAQLLGLGYYWSDENSDSRNDTRGDKVVRELARQRQARVSEQCIDQALCVLLNERLPSVIRIPELETDIGESSASICSETIASMPLAEEDIQLLKRKVMESEPNLPLADRTSIRNLASSIMDEESLKKGRQQHTCSRIGRNSSF